MKYCSNCFKEVCGCESEKVDIDYYIYPAIYEFNRKGYDTGFCCSGHEDAGLMQTYIVFRMDIEEEIDSEYFQFETYNYRGAHVRRHIIRVKPEINKLFKKKRTNKLKLIQDTNREIYKWAKSLPNIAEEEREEIDFSDSYFDKEE